MTLAIERVKYSSISVPMLDLNNVRKKGKRKGGLVKLSFVLQEHFSSISNKTVDKIASRSDYLTKM